MFIKTNKVRRANRTYEYLSLVEGYRDEHGRPRQRTLYRLGEAGALRDSGELDRIVAALSAHAERRYIDVADLDAVDRRHRDSQDLVGQPRLGDWFTQVGRARRLSWSLADAVFAMVANRLLDPASNARRCGGSRRMSWLRPGSRSLSWSSTTGRWTTCTMSRASSRPSWTPS